LTSNLNVDNLASLSFPSAAKECLPPAHGREEGGLWAEVPSIQGCATQGDTFDKLLENLYEAI
jgi:hypothetical protein